jgi:uncharacterized protein YjhX (UPF0386 family)
MDKRQDIPGESKAFAPVSLLGNDCDQRDGRSRADFDLQLPKASELYLVRSKLEIIVRSTYGGSYGITERGAREWKSKCPDLRYVGAYRMTGDVKLALRSLGVETR